MTTNRRSKSGLRGFSRMCAVQARYQLEVVDQNIDELISNFIINKGYLSEELVVPEMDCEFFKNLMYISQKNLNEIDKILADNLNENWTFDRLDITIKNIVRLGIAEIVYFLEIPLKVVINEYVELAKSFFDKSEVTFVNGILHKVSQTYRPTGE